MSKAQSNRLSAEQNGNLIEWRRGDGSLFVRLDLSKLAGIPAAMECGGLARSAIIMGLTQTVGDSGAMNRTDAQGSIIPADEFWAEKKRRMIRRIETLYRGEWSAKPEAEWINLLREALSRFAPKSAKAAEFLRGFDNMTKEEKEKLAASPTIAAEMRKIRDERAPKGGEEFLDDLIQS